MEWLPMNSALDHLIMKRKPRMPFKNGMRHAEWVLIRRRHRHRPWVVAVVTPVTLEHNEWLHATYFNNEDDALAAFDEKKSFTPSAT
jgi:hypothetical protein